MTDVLGWTAAAAIAILTIAAWSAVLVRAKRGDYGPGVLDPSAPAAEDIEKARRPSLASLQAGWTPQEREAFGINETEALIASIDRELADHKRAGAPGPIFRAESITAGQIRAGSITGDRIWVG